MYLAGEDDKAGGRRNRRQKMDDDTSPAAMPLIPGLPDHLAQLCLARVPATLLYSLSQSCRRLLYSPSFPPFLSLYALLSSSPENRHSSPELGFYSYDPLCAAWAPLPSVQQPAITRRHPTFINRPLPVQSVAVAGKLLLISASDADLAPALPRPLIFHPDSAQWLIGPPFLAPRRWCVAGSLRGAVYVISGVGAEYSSAVARSVQRWDVTDFPFAPASAWMSAPAMRDGRFSREAVEAVGCRGKLCIVNVRGTGAKEGTLYDADTGRWEEMPPGMLAGWSGPAAAMDEYAMYVVDEASGELRVYDWEKDQWHVILHSEQLASAAAIAVAGGRVCIVEAGGKWITVVNVGAAVASVYRVEAPAGMEVVDVHVLPRVSRPDW